MNMEFSKIQDGYKQHYLNNTSSLFIPDKTIEDKDRLPSYQDYMKARENEVPPYHIGKAVHFPNKELLTKASKRATNIFLVYIILLLIIIISIFLFSLYGKG